MPLKTPTMLSRRGLMLAAGAAAASAGLPALAQPSTIRFVLPNATGSGVDAITRAAQPALGRALGASVVVENQPGAGGVVGLQTLSRAAPDGATLAVVSNNVVIFPSVLKSLPFDMPGDFTPIAVVGATPMVLVVNPNKLAVNNAAELFAQLKARPGDYNFGSGGNGTILHLATEMLLEASGTRARHIPYKGVGPMVGDLIGGQIDFASVAVPSVQSQIKAGMLRPIGLFPAQRSASLPEVPTFAEQGLKDFAVDAWFAVIGPKGLGAEQVKKVHAAVVAAFDDPAVKETMAKQGNTIQVSTPEQAQQMFRSELARFAALVKKVGLEPQ